MANRNPVLLVPLITPLLDDGSIDGAQLSAIARDVVEQGAAGVVLFGTLGEAQSFSLTERKAALEALVASGCSPDGIMVGIGAAALTDVVELARHAIGQGCFRQLLLPPFFFKGISNEGLEDFIAQAIDRIGDDRLRLTLYDIPSVVSVSIERRIIRSLIDRYGPIIAGIKDSVPDAAHVRDSVTDFPELAVFVGNEIFLPEAIALGAAGAISGLGNIAPAQMARIAGSETKADDPVFQQMCTLYAAIARHPVVPAVKALAGWRFDLEKLATVRPPLKTFDLKAAPDLIEILQELHRR